MFSAALVTTWTHLLVGVGQNDEKVFIKDVDEKWIKTIWFSSYYSRTAQSDKCDHVLPFLDAGLIPRDRRDNVLVFERESLYLRNIAWKEANETLKFRPEMFHGQAAVKDT